MLTYSTRTITLSATRRLCNNNIFFKSQILRNHASRQMSVTILSDEKAVEKFLMINNKSVLYFTASWCPPCKIISPIYEKISKEHNDVAFGKVDVDDNSDSAIDFEISSVPTFVFLQNEKRISRFSGADEKMLKQNIEELKNV